MLPTPSYAASSPKSVLKPFQINRREPGPRDVLVEINYCGVCHSDIHQVRDEWGGSAFPMVPGHEIVGRVRRTGSRVSAFHEGDRVGVGCFVDSCRSCSSCKEGLEQYCEVGTIVTYNGTEKDGKTPTYGGYSTQIVVDENYVLKIPNELPLQNAAPLLCAGITTYSPLRHWGAGPGVRVGVIGLGGLGHMGVKLAKAMGAEVTVISSSTKKKSDAARLGAKDFIATSEPGVFQEYSNRFDLILNSVSAPTDINAYLNFLDRDGVMVLLGVPEKAPELAAFSLIGRRRSIAGSLIGGIRETQEMLDFCGKNNVTSDIELIPIQRINEAYERVIRGDVKYRFVIDIESLHQSS